jgi:hypothetical protein
MEPFFIAPASIADAFKAFACLLAAAAVAAVVVGVRGSD